MHYKLTCFIGLILLTYSCSGAKFIKAYSSLDTKKTFTDQIFIKRDITYKVGDLGQGWELIDLDYGDLAFYSPSLGSTININSTCSNARKHYDLTILSDSLLTGFKNKQLLLRSVVSVNNDDALESKYYGEYKNAEVVMSIVVYQKEFCVYDFSYVSSKPNFDEGYKEYIDFIADFRLIENEE